MTTAFEHRYGIQDPDDTRWLWTADPIVAYEHPEFTAHIVGTHADPATDRGTRFHLVWTDHVANDWVEHFGTMALAVMRLGALIDCVDTDGTFTQDAEDFAALASVFLEGTSA